MIKFKFEEDDSARIDVYLSRQLPTLSRAFVQKLLKQGKILVNKVVPKAGQKLRYGDLISVDYNLSDVAQIQTIDLPVIYEDSDCIVVNKPIGVLSHSRDSFSREATVASFVRSRVIDIDGDRAGIVHRLDRATSGVMLCAKTSEALTWFQKQFSSRRVKKTYVAIVKGHPTRKEALIDIPIARNPKMPSRFRGDSNGKSATTLYEVIESSEHYSMLKLSPRTGRTHQLRVHLAHIGHPIVGDSFYDGEVADRLYLHALSLEIALPSNAIKLFEAPLPKEFKLLLKND